MSLFKAKGEHEDDPVWAILHFSTPIDAIILLRHLVALLCRSSDYEEFCKHEVDINTAFLSSILSIFDLLQRQPPSLNAVGTTPIDLLYQVCGHAILQLIPRLIFLQSSILALFVTRVATALARHVLTIQERCQESSRGHVDRTLARVKTEGPQEISLSHDQLSVKDQRSDMPAVVSLEKFFVQSLGVLLEHYMQIVLNTQELFHLRLIMSKLLYSTAMQTIGIDESGMNIQCVVIRISTHLVQVDSFPDPLGTIDHILQHYVHLESQCLVRFIYRCLKEWQKRGENELEFDMTVTNSDTSSSKPSKEEMKGGNSNTHNNNIKSAQKRTIDDVDNEQGTGQDDLKGKRTRNEQDATLNSSLSIDSTNCSSIIPHSQFSQRLSDLPTTLNDSLPSYRPSEHLLTLLKRYANFQPFYLTASQGSRGVQPPLTVNDLRSIIVLTQVWLEFGPCTQDAKDGEDLCSFNDLIESIFKSYLFWALSPGMQNASLNQQYLTSSYPLVLDLVAVLTQFELKETLVELLICVASSPWFPDIARDELWNHLGQTTPFNPTEGQRQLVHLIETFTTGTEIHARLRATPGALLGPYKGLKREKKKALQVIATLGHTHRGSQWCKELVLEAIVPGPDSCLYSGESQSIRAVGIDCVAVMSTHYPNMKSTCEAAASLALGLTDDDLLMDALAQFMGTVFCGLSTDNEQLGPHLQRVFYHLRPEDLQLGTLPFGKFLLESMLDERKAVQESAGNVLECIAIMAKPSLSIDILGPTPMDRSLATVCKAIVQGLRTPAHAKRLFQPMLSMSRKIMWHLPEDHPSYSHLSQVLIDEASTQKVKGRSTFAFATLSLIAKDKNQSHYRFLQPQIELVCTIILNKLSQGRDAWLRTFFLWVGQSFEVFVKNNLSNLLPKAILVQQEILVSKLCIDPNVSPAMLCVNFVDAILATVFMEDNLDNFEKSIKFLIGFVQAEAEARTNNRLRSLGLPELTTLSIQSLLCKLSLELGDEQESRRKRALDVIKMVDNYAWQNELAEMEGRPNKVEGRRSLSTFLCRHILGILSDINNAIQESNRAITLRSKARYLRSLDGIVGLLQPIPNSALAQVISPLTTALDIPTLRQTSLGVLAKILSAIATTQIEELLPIMVHTLSKVYIRSNEREKKAELAILKSLLVDRHEYMAAVIPNVGVLPDLPEFKLMNQIVAASKSSLSIDEQVASLLERSMNENSELAELALIELRRFMLENESWLLSLVSQRSSGLDRLIVPIVHTLLEGVGRFRGLDAPVPRLCVECLGIVGAIDPALIGLRRKPTMAPLQGNFSDLEEARTFVCDLIERQLVGSACSVGDYISESQWAYALQSLLLFCGITKDVLDADRLDTAPASRHISQRSSGTYSQVFPPSPTSSQSSVKKPLRLSSRERWKLFPRHVQECLELFIGAKYSKNNSSADNVYPRPHYNHVTTFKEWLTRWTRQLIAQAKGTNAVRIFEACKHVVVYDINICLFILPHLVLNILLEGSASEQKGILDEMAAVLADGVEQPQVVQISFSVNTTHSSEKHQLGCQAVFTLFDHISKWIQLRKNAASKAPVSRAQTANDFSTSSSRLLQDKDLNNMQAHLRSISHGIIAMASLRCKAYARALFHYEQHIRIARQDSQVTVENLQEMYEKLQGVYVHMEDPDGMEGLASLITSGMQTQHLLQCESAGRWSEALSYYECWRQEDPGNLSNHVGLYKCLDQLGQHDTLLAAVQGDIDLRPGWEQSLTEWRVEAAWKVQDWKVLDSSLKRHPVYTFEGGLGQLILDMRENRKQDFVLHMEQVRSRLVAPLAAASMESYARSYDQVVQLHLLRELELANERWNATMVDGAEHGGHTYSYASLLRDMEDLLSKRLSVMAPSFRVREQVLRLRRIAFYDIRVPAMKDDADVSFIQKECGELWLQSAQAARHSSNSQVAFSSMLRAEEKGIQSALIERIKWGFEHNQERQAFQFIDSAMVSLRSSNSAASLGGSNASGSKLGSLVQGRGANGGSRSRPSSNPISRVEDIDLSLRRVQDRVLQMGSPQFLRAKVLMLRTKRMDQSNLVNSLDITDGYRDAIHEYTEWEKGYYLLGQHFFKLFDASKRTARVKASNSPNVPTINYALATQGVRFYAKALSLGPKYLYQILPRLLTFWLDQGDEVAKNKNNVDVNSLYRASEFRNITELMNRLCEVLPPYMFLSAFPQIISRMCHKNVDAFVVLQKIISVVVVDFPDQAIWQMVSLSKSTVPERKRVCNSILDHIATLPTLGTAIFEQIKAALELCDQLIALCMAAVPDKTVKLSLERNFPKIAKLLRTPSNVTIPFHLSLWPALPESSRTMATHRAFPETLPKIDHFLDEVEVMTSLQKPRKVTIVGSDGNHYTFLCKPKDDLRKDAKVMEFNGLVNMLLRKNREASRRDLYIRTYAVVPLNEECGLIQWVHNTVPYRHIMQKQYKVNGITTLPITEIKKILDSDDNVKLFVRDLLPR
ncbi:serine/threonine-protein kinase M1 [Podila epigama]|nr:serine/threonine-protein kinase M1 [Podila epigama]